MSNSITKLFAGATLMALASCTGSEAGADIATTSTDSCENAVIETIMARRSIRKYKDTPVEREKLEQIAKCGINAPNGLNKQPWQIRIVDSKEYIDSLTAVFAAAEPERAAEPGFKNIFRNAPAVIFVASPADGSGQLDCGLMGENIVLAAQSLGLGTCCLGSPVMFMYSNENARPFVERLQLPDDYKLLYAIAVGYPDEQPQAKPRDESKIKFID